MLSTREIDDLLETRLSNPNSEGTMETIIQCLRSENTLGDQDDVFEPAKVENCYEEEMCFDMTDYDDMDDYDCGGLDVDFLVSLSRNVGELEHRKVDPNKRQSDSGSEDEYSESEEDDRKSMNSYMSLSTIAPPTVSTLREMIVKGSMEIVGATERSKILGRKNCGFMLKVKMPTELKSKSIRQGMNGEKLISIFRSQSTEEDNYGLFGRLVDVCDELGEFDAVWTKMYLRELINNSKRLMKTFRNLE
jgi:hypothetical protein